MILCLLELDGLGSKALICHSDSNPNWIFYWMCVWVWVCVFVQCKWHIQSRLSDKYTVWKDFDFKWDFLSVVKSIPANSIFCHLRCQSIYIDFCCFNKYYLNRINMIKLTFFAVNFNKLISNLPNRERIQKQYRMLQGNKCSVFVCIHIMVLSSQFKMQILLCDNW